MFPSVVSESSMPVNVTVLGSLQSEEVKMSESGKMLTSLMSEEDKVMITSSRGADSSTTVKVSDSSCYEVISPVVLFTIITSSTSVT